MNLYYEPIKILDKITKEATPEMSEWQSAYLCGLIKEFKPTKILEVGVAAGGTTALILNALALQGNKAEVWSVDISKNYYAKPWLKTGFMAEEAKDIIESEHVNHNLRIGMVPEVIDEIGKGIDFLILDTVHNVPGEILDFPVCLPYLKENAVVVLHDVILHAVTEFTNNFATQLLLDCVTADKFHVFGYDNELGYPNIAAFRVNKDTRKYIYDVFSLLLLPWHYDVDNREIQIYRDKYNQLGYSKECIEVFERSVIANKHIKHQRIINRVNKIKVIVDVYCLLAGKKLYIYGAGEVGQYILHILENVVEFKGFVVSDGQKHTEGVYVLSELEKIIEQDDVVYVAVAYDKINDIKENLEKSNIKNIEYIDSKLLSCIYDYD